MAKTGASQIRDELILLWLAKLGRAEIDSVLKQVDQDRSKEKMSIIEKSRILATSFKSAEEIDRLILRGFSGPYHQTVYLYRPNNLDNARTSMSKLAAQKLKSGLQISVVVQQGDGVITALSYVPYQLRFAKGTTLETKTFQIPCVVELRKKSLVFRTITVKSVRWDRLLGQDVELIGATVRSSTLLASLAEFAEKELGIKSSLVDFTKKAIQFLNRDGIDVTSGTIEEADEEGPIAQTRCRILRSRGGKGLKKSVPKKFQELINAEVVNDCIVIVNKPELMLPVETVFTLHPSAGAISITRKGDFGDFDGLYDFLAG